MREPLPLADLQSAVLEFMQGRDDVVVFGAQAVNAYASEPRMAQHIAVLAIHAEAFAQELCDYLHERFHIAMRTRSVAQGRGIRLYQMRKSGNRHLVDVRSVEELPSSKRIGGVLVMAPADLIAAKAIACHSQQGQPQIRNRLARRGDAVAGFPESQAGARSRLQPDAGRRRSPRGAGALGAIRKTRNPACG
ncbi:MAG: hypothetical protein NTX50_13585 [Candidatus Sumerlaeota bacterium]|nr:hypothetical protein [Candidatus Sumerlaeota bacterium]